MRLNRFVGLALVFCTAGSAAGGEPIRLADGVWLIEGSFTPGSQPDGNSIVFEGTDGLVVVDTGRHHGHTERILRLARERQEPIVAIVNTHWHLDHTGGNVLLRRAFPDIEVIATDAVVEARSSFLLRYRAQLETMLAAASGEDGKEADLRAEIALIDEGDSLLPTHTASSPQVRRIGGRELDLRVTRHAATASDIWMRDASSGIVLAGDLVTLPAPFFDTADAEGWKDALEQIAGTRFTVLVPGHGAPMNRVEFERYRLAFASLLECAGVLETLPSVCGERWIADAGDLLDASQHRFAAAMVEYYVENSLRPAQE